MSGEDARCATSGTGIQKAAFVFFFFKCTARRAKNGSQQRLGNLDLHSSVPSALQGDQSRLDEL